MSYVYVIITLINFYLWKDYGSYVRNKHHIDKICPKADILDPFHLCKQDTNLNNNNNKRIDKEIKNVIPLACSSNYINKLPIVTSVNTDDFQAYRDNNLAFMRFPPFDTIVVNFHPSDNNNTTNNNGNDKLYNKLKLTKSSNESNCISYTNIHQSGIKWSGCLAVVPVDGAPLGYNLNRFDSNPIYKGHLESGELSSTGFFHVGSNQIGRGNLINKMTPFLTNLIPMEKYIANRLLEKDLAVGTDIVVMVVNDGEIDLFLNFICSCQAYKISVNNIVVFAGSEDIIPLIDSTGAVGLYHESFAFVSKHASAQYLDKTFVDMMWYKSFSVWVVLKLGYHILFQDVDIVWFKHPLDYIKNLQLDRVKKNLSIYDAYFSDDGQRSLRYSPFYANSGFYYLLANERSEQYLWSIVISFDVLHVSGSHQNVFTQRLIEALDLCRLDIFLLPIRYFPSGVKYHHDHPYMKALQDGHEQPYMFHMCWTLDKKTKLENFPKVGMWYLKDTCGDIGKTFRLDKSIKHVSECCNIMETAPFVEK